MDKYSEPKCVRIDGHISVRGVAVSNIARGAWILHLFESGAVVRGITSKRSESGARQKLRMKTG